MNFVNEHGNSPLHYACFWDYREIASDLVNHGAIVSLANKDGDTALDKSRGGTFIKSLHDLAVDLGQDLKKIHFKDQSWLGLKTRSRDATLSRYRGINVKEVDMKDKIDESPSGVTWRGRWQKNDIVAKILKVIYCNENCSLLSKLAIKQGMVYQYTRYDRFLVVFFPH